MFVSEKAMAENCGLRERYISEIKSDLCQWYLMYKSSQRIPNKVKHGVKYRFQLCLPLALWAHRSWSTLHAFPQSY